MKRLVLIGFFVMVVAAVGAAAEAKKVIFLAGSASHGSGEHEHPAGCLLLKKCLDRCSGISSEVHLNGWPKDPASAFAGASTVVIYSDGGGGHPFLQGDRLKTIRELMDKGVGLVCIHYAVEPTKEKGEAEFLDWIGGCFELDWSVNPAWMPDFKALPEHPITRGIKPFKLHDEWYFHMRFREGMQGVTPILSVVPPAETMQRGDGPHEGNPAVREAVKKGEPQVLAWAFERAKAGRGFGFTGGHFYRNWGNDNFRNLVLNAILWTAKAEVPAEGIQSHITPEELKENLERR